MHLNRRSNRWDIKKSAVIPQSSSSKMRRSRSGSDSRSDSSRSPSPTSKFLYGGSDNAEDPVNSSTNQKAPTSKAWTSMLDIPIPTVTKKSPEKPPEPKSTLDERIKDFE